MGDWIGYAIGAVSTIILLTDKLVNAIRGKNKLIAEQATEKATLQFECDDLKKTAKEIKENVRESYSVLAKALEALEQTMMKSDEYLGDRISKVEVNIKEMCGIISGHTEAINNLKDDVKIIKRKVS